MDDSHNSSMEEMRRMLASWQRHSAHCKAEYEQLSARMESRMKDLNEELVRTRLRADQLLKLHNDTKEALTDV